MIVVELDSVTIWWVRQETLPAATFKRKKNRSYYFNTDLYTALLLVLLLLLPLCNIPEDLGLNIHNRRNFVAHIN
jgi:hypothetical protein